MTSTQRLPVSLAPLDVALALLLEGLRPVGPIETPLAQALGCVAADMPALPANPACDRAAVDGWALHARDLAGASSYSPLPLAQPPLWVEAGDRMPDGCDCVVDADLVDHDGPLAQVLAEAMPGQGIRRRGGDIAEGGLVVGSGQPVRPLDLLIARMAGLETLQVRRPRLRIVNIPAASGLAATTRLVSESAGAAGAAIVCNEAAGRDAASIADALDGDACDLLLTIGGSGVGRTDATIAALSRRGDDHRAWARGAARPDLGDRQDRTNSRRRAARRSGSGARGVVDAGAAGARPIVRTVAAAAGPAAAVCARSHRASALLKSCCSKEMKRLASSCGRRVVAADHRPCRRLAGGSRRQRGICCGCRGRCLYGTGLT